MYKTILVERSIEQGRQLLGALKAHKFAFDLAFWHRDEESKVWRLVIISPEIDRHGSTKSYLKVFDALDSIAPSELAWLDIRLMGTKDPNLDSFGLGRRHRGSRSLKNSSGPLYGESYLYQL